MVTLSNILGQRQENTDDTHEPAPFRPALDFAFPGDLVKEKDDIRSSHSGIPAHPQQKQDPAPQSSAPVLQDTTGMKAHDGHLQCTIVKGLQGTVFQSSAGWADLFWKISMLTRSGEARPLALGRRHTRSALPIPVITTGAERCTLAAGTLLSHPILFAAAAAQSSLSVP
ncbi:hypothetical protein Landi51_11711 [Colletotrichum acutatum]